ncbi:hypothetical protein SDC9_31347 [bioreactor metagenome]|jgi:hypothetical protein|uniref:Uncharacterized protein n=1 Tax=bioreactor metagenome TaxID=1076179 RepID=A0A644V223_9ZZZZ|nr:hypothetical protein [Acidaminococcaceae bacterium]NLU45306.1 hypothetical protein [Acholeplasmataceae bacterium]
MVRQEVPNVLAFPLGIAIERLCALNIPYEVIRTFPQKRHDEFMWRDEDAYVVKQVVTLDHKVVLTVGCKCRKEV